jgi:hypothetical protein
LLFLILVACSHTQNNKKIIRERAEQSEKKLRVGMSFEEVSRHNKNLGNCEGSKNSIMICEWKFTEKTEENFIWEQNGKTAPRTQAEDLPSHSLDGLTYELIFQENKLQRWRIKDNEELP